MLTRLTAPACSPMFELVLSVINLCLQVLKLTPTWYVAHSYSPRKAGQTQLLCSESLAKSLHTESTPTCCTQNVDAGTMSPFEHGEVFVMNDGGEVSVAGGEKLPPGFKNAELTVQHVPTGPFRAG